VIAVIEAVGSVSGANPLPTTLVQTSTAVITPPARTQAAPMNAPRLSFFARNRLAREAATRRSTAHGAGLLTATQLEIGRRMQRSKQTAPHFYLTTSANAEGLIALRTAASGQTPPQKLVWDAFFVIAAANALHAFPHMAMQFDGERLTPRPTTAIGVAADVDDALYLIAIAEPLTQTVATISAQITQGMERLRQGDPAAKKLTPTAFTITNLGAENIESFMAIINPGEAAILAIGKVAPTVQPQGREIVIQHRVNLSLSVDHRVVNGKYAAAFLSRIVVEIERF
jgi:pyruvate dehydrogenase E2 component (dihydrolipoamide acetyltransferase)